MIITYASGALFRRNLSVTLHTTHPNPTDCQYLTLPDCVDNHIMTVCAEGLHLRSPVPTFLLRKAKMQYQLNCKVK